MAEKSEKLKLEVVGGDGDAVERVSIPKPSAFSLDKFKSKRGAAVAGVEPLLTALPHHKLSDAKDFVRLHPDEDNYWSPELCFVNIPIKGMKRDTMHLIDEEVAVRHLPSQKILRFRLALASKPFDIFFLCHVPSQNTDNTWVDSNLKACEQSKVLWTQATSRKDEGVEAYKVDPAKDADAFPPPNWPTQTLSELIEATFTGRIIDSDDHPGLARLVGAKPSMS